MSVSSFAPGQRWVSNTESELGLGIVETASVRQVLMSFPAAGEKRAYAIDNAPLSRVLYDPGERINTEGGLSVVVRERTERGGCLIYAGVDEQGEETHVHELELDSFVRFSRPRERLFAGQVDKDSAFNLRVDVMSQAARHARSEALGLLGARVKLIPHQLYIASTVAARYHPRVLLADEVGLGKTIEAGLVLHRQILSGRVERVLVVVPDSLIHQWLVEMLRRFNLWFTILDEDRCEALAESGVDNPFESAQLVLCSLSFIEHPAHTAQAEAAGFDILVVDEAHHLEWRHDTPSDAYACIERLAGRFPGLLLLTATPEQLGLEGHFGRLRLLDPDRYFDLDAFRETERGYRELQALIERIGGEGSAARLRDDAALRGEVESRLGALDPDAFVDDGSDDAVSDVVERLLDHYGTGRVLFRNTREVVGGFPPRHYLPHPIAVEPASGPVGLEMMTDPEAVYGENWLALDPRVAWLTDWLEAHRTEKVLVICARATVAQALEEHLRLRGVRSSVFHEGMTLVARDRSAAYFADRDEDAQVLVCSEIGSEGRNFQSAHHLVLFDLPLDPDLLEQRIGRLDRIGQHHPISIHLPYVEGSAEGLLQRWYHEGLDAFESPCEVGRRVVDAMNERLQAALAGGGGEDALVADTRILAESLLEELRAGRDRLLELNSFRPAVAHGVVESIAEAERSSELGALVERLLDHYGVEQQAHGARSIVVKPGDHMAVHSIPGLPEDGMTATFDRAEALSREDMHFLTWEHPMVSGLIDMVVNGDFGNTSVITIEVKPLVPGTVLAEAIFSLHCPAPKGLQVHRFLPESSARVVVDDAGRDLGQVLTAEQLSRLANRVPTRTAQELIKHARDRVSVLVEHAERRVETGLEERVAAARSRAEALLGAERDRLEALARVNPTVRRSEIEALEEASARIAEHLGHAQYRLDALRVIVAT